MLRGLLGGLRTLQEALNPKILKTMCSLMLEDKRHIIDHEHFQKSSNHAWPKKGKQANVKVSVPAQTQCVQLSAELLGVD